MADQKYTPIGHEIWRWWRTELWKPLASDPEAKMLWLLFYTSREAKGSVPGLWPGSVYTMADHTGMSPNAAHNTLDRLITHRLAQFDADNLLVRFAVPDALDRAHTAQAIWGWWGRFKTLPSCALRNAHVPMLWGLIQAGKTNQKMVDTWKETFGTIVIPTHVPAFLPPSSSDTSTGSQPSLFGPPPMLLLPPPNKINNSGPSSLARDLGSGSGSGLSENGEADEPEPPCSDQGPNGPGDRVRGGRPTLHLVPNDTELTGNRLAQDAQEAADLVVAERVAENRRALREAVSAAGLRFFTDTVDLPTSKAMTDGPDPADKIH